MGRAKRKRKRRCKIQSFEHEDYVVALKKFMINSGYENNFNLSLKDFPATGRGVACTRNLEVNTILLRIPLDVMINYATLEFDRNFMALFNSRSKLKIHDLLVAFLIYERHKQRSFWKDYLNSLPREAPSLPCLLPRDRIDSLPVDLRVNVEKSRRLMEESWSRLRKSMAHESETCICCHKQADRVILDISAFTWAFVMVNSRAVYIDPQFLRENFHCAISDSILENEPTMALCPYLDMFNHSCNASTEAEVTCIQGKHFYQLKTQTSYKKYEQVFISYGDHDNIKLLVEYGFFIPGNCHDAVTFRYEEVADILRLNLTKNQFEFVKRHGLTDNLALYLNDERNASFTLKGLLYVIHAESLKNCITALYTDTYPQKFHHQVREFYKKLLERKLDEYRRLVEEFGDVSVLLSDYFRYMVARMDHFINKQ